MSAARRPLADLLRLFVPPALWFAHFVVLYGAEALICTPPAAARATFDLGRRDRDGRGTRGAGLVRGHAAPAPPRIARTSTPVRHSCAAWRCCWLCSAALGVIWTAVPGRGSSGVRKSRRLNGGTDGACGPLRSGSLIPELVHDPRIAPFTRTARLLRRACSLRLRRQRQAAGGGERRAGPDPAAAGDLTDPDRRYRAREGLARGRDADARRRTDRDGLGQRSRSSALALSCCRTATCWSPRPTRRSGPSARASKTVVMNMVMKRAGAGVPSANRITLLRDADGDGIAETRTEFLKGLNSPFGMALIGDDLYVANTDAVVRFPYKEGATQISEAGTKVADLPGGPAQPSLDQGPDGEPRRHASSMRRSARTATSPRTASRRKTSAPRSSRSTSRPGSRACSRPACAIRSAWRSIRRPASSGPWSTSATRSAATSSPTI